MNFILSKGPVQHQEERSSQFFIMRPENSNTDNQNDQLVHVSTTAVTTTSATVAVAGDSGLASGTGASTLTTTSSNSSTSVQSQPPMNNRPIRQLNTNNPLLDLSHKTPMCKSNTIMEKHQQLHGEKHSWLLSHYS